MSRTKAVSERNVRQQYILVKAHAPNIATLVRNDYNFWFLGNVPIGGTCREAAAYLTGLRAGILAAPFLHSKAG